MAGASADLRLVRESVDGDGGVAHGGELVAFTNAVMGDDDGALRRERDRLRAVLSPEALVDVCAVVAAFNVVDRIADATGIPLDAMLFAASQDLRDELRLGEFESAANTPGARG